MSNRWYTKVFVCKKLVSGRFAKVGLPNPDFFCPLVATLEITCGILLLLGLLTWLAAIPLFLYHAGSHPYDKS
ncbi:DoxX family membrane protein [Segetibacter sp. 3557_3]|uniref:DoxX family membrane protein n=1 Tax=Segetibacter sp. 3557_3 TaxID=2547429 RepID=UPI001A9FB989|nr:DoxX family membrane protein [Segetibacter sp. 3557_3]